MSNIQIGCDSVYYKNWGIALLQSIEKHNPWINLHCHIVNPEENLTQLPFVNYTFENKKFNSLDEEKYYLQICRFVAVVNNFKQSDLVLTIDTDSICTQSFTEKDFLDLFNQISILPHHKDTRWLAGFITFPNSDFRYKLLDKIFEEPIENWKFIDRIGGRDQQALNELQQQYTYTPIDRYWMSIGKNRANSVFLTLKGAQKTTTKYLGWYNKYRN